jgi:hypothetical protein
MFGTAVSPNCMPVRTHRGERPDKMRHPQSSNSTDVMEGFLMTTQLNNTTSINFCNTYRHQNNNQNSLTVKLWLGLLQLFHFFGSPFASARREIAPGPQGCVIMDVPCHYLIDKRKETSMSARVLAIMLVLIVIAGSQPALLLHRLLDAGLALLKLFG